MYSLKAPTSAALPYIVIDGRAVADAELKFTQSGRAFAKFRVAANGTFSIKKKKKK